MKNIYILLTLLATSAHADFNNLWVSKYDNLIVELGDNKYESSIIKNWVSSLPKWYEATIKKTIKEIDGRIIQKNITLREIKMYDK